MNQLKCLTTCTVAFCQIVVDVESILSWLLPIAAHVINGAVRTLYLIAEIVFFK